MIKGMIIGAAAVLLLLGGYLAFFNKDQGLTGNTVKLLTNSQPNGAGNEAAIPSQAAKLSADQAQVAYRSLILDILELRENEKKDILKQAELVSRVNQDIQQIGSENIQDKWETAALCLSKGCTDNDYLQLILTISLEGERQGYGHGSLIMNILTANKYWGTDNTIRFSDALDKAHKEASSSNDPAVTEAFKNWVACDQCNNRNDLTFGLIRTIAENQK